MATEEGSVPSPDFYLADKPAEGADQELFEAWEKNVVELSILAEKAERYNDMCRFLTQVVESKHNRKTPLVENERNLLSVAFKNIVGGLRSSWRTFMSANNDDGEENAALQKAFSKIVEHELEQKCLEVLGILENKLIPTCDQNTESHVFYEKMCGDYYRYLAEFREAKDYKDNAYNHYNAAYEIAKVHLPETHPTRLGLALNFSVCHYEILENHSKACTLAKRAFDEAIQKLDTLNDANYKDSTLIMQLLRDNLTLWTQEDKNENED